MLHAERPLSGVLARVVSHLVEPGRPAQQVTDDLLTKPVNEPSVLATRLENSRLEAGGGGSTAIGVDMPTGPATDTEHALMTESTARRANAASPGSAGFSGAL
jgi:hypothetical protein